MCGSGTLLWRALWSPPITHPVYCAIISALSAGKAWCAMLEKTKSWSRATQKDRPGKTARNRGFWSKPSYRQHRFSPIANAGLQNKIHVERRDMKTQNLPKAGNPVCWSAPSLWRTLGDEQERLSYTKNSVHLENALYRLESRNDHQQSGTWLSLRHTFTKADYSV